MRGYWISQIRRSPGVNGQGGVVQCTLRIPADKIGLVVGEGDENRKLMESQSKCTLLVNEVRACWHDALSGRSVFAQLRPRPPLHNDAWAAAYVSHMSRHLAPPHIYRDINLKKVASREQQYRDLVMKAASLEAVNLAIKLVTHAVSGGVTPATPTPSQSTVAAAASTTTPAAQKSELAVSHRRWSITVWLTFFRNRNQFDVCYAGAAWWIGAAPCSADAGGIFLSSSEYCGVSCPRALSGKHRRVER